MTLFSGNVKKVALIHLFSTLYFYLPILTIYYQQRGLNFVQINSLWGIITGTTFLTEVPTGIFADKFGRKKSVIIALVLQLIGEILFLGAQNYFQFVFISIIAGIGFAFQSGCIEALVYDSLKECHQQDQMKRAAGLTGAYYQAGHVISALLSSFIVVQLTQPRIILSIILTIISVGVALTISFFLREPKIKYQHREERPLFQFSQAIASMRHNPNLKRIILLGIFTTPFIGYLRNFHPPYFAQIGIAPIWLGISLALGGLLSIIASKYAYLFEQKLGVKWGMLFATIIPGILYLLMALIGQPILAVMLFILNFGFMSVQDPLFADYYNLHLESHWRATALSSINMLSSAYIAVIGLLIGWIADIKLDYAFIFMGVMVVLGAALFRINQKHLVLNHNTERKNTT